ncbi:helix-turn-helix domain-containing protein [Halobacillus hunanensis]|uniref:helix-turn-helix domain-containing protein n=1 Tax=Halobacillus hunanensis TaxID=578214 RepID=UPI0009A64565|nr:helix-turn-helix domain-containing protein [Halobacillus hunanensis]
MNLAEIRNLQSFPSKKELDLRVRAFLYHHKQALSEGTLTVLKYIWRHSVKYTGVSFAKVETIQDKTNKSRSTVIRAINCLEKKGLLKRVPTLRPNGKRGVNILVLQAEGSERLPKKKPVAPSSLDSAPETAPTEQTLHETQPAETDNIQEKIQHPPVIDADYLPSYIPESFLNVSRPFLTPHDILSAWKSVQRAYQKVNLTQPLEWYIEQINRTFKRAVFAQRQGTIKKSFLGYFYGSLKEAFIQIVRKEVMADSSNLYYNWLDNES